LLKSAFVLCIIAILLPAKSNAQIDDVGAWFGVSFEKKFSRRLLVSLGEQLRLNQDVTAIDVFFTDAGIEYLFTKKLKAGIHYRFINSNQENYYSKRHRFYFDLSYKDKIKFVTLSVRGRIQEQFTNFYSSETGKIPEWVARPKLTAKFDLDKKYSPYVSSELFYIVDNAKSEHFVNSGYRYEAGITYDFNRLRSINPFILFQHTHKNEFNELIYGLTYTMAF
jgi:hypothetical protein